jgi:hypothetical protein
VVCDLQIVSTGWRFGGGRDEERSLGINRVGGQACFLGIGAV